MKYDDALDEYIAALHKFAGVIRQHPSWGGTQWRARVALLVLGAEAVAGSFLYLKAEPPPEIHLN